MNKQNHSHFIYFGLSLFLIVVVAKIPSLRFYLLCFVSACSMCFVVLYTLSRIFMACSTISSVLFLESYTRSYRCCLHVYSISKFNLSSLETNKILFAGKIQFWKTNGENCFFFDKNCVHFWTKYHNKIGFSDSFITKSIAWRTVHINCRCFSNSWKILNDCCYFLCVFSWKDL